MQTPLGCAKAKGAGREENVLAGGARGRWRSRGREWTSWRDQNLEDPVKFFGGVIISYPVNFEELGSETPLFSFSVHFHFLKL